MTGPADVEPTTHEIMGEDGRSSSLAHEEEDQVDGEDHGQSEEDEEDDDGDHEDDEEVDEEDDDGDHEDDEEDDRDGEGTRNADESNAEKKLRLVSKALAKVLPSGGFFVSGTRGVFPQPGLAVEGVGKVNLPILGEAAKTLIGQCHLAPYGLGEQTLVDTQVRNTWEISAEHVEQENPAWDKMIQADILAACRIPLGIPEETQVQAKLYKMLLYEAGGKFEKHQDSEKEDGMFGTLVVVLPGRFEGGQLLVHDPSAGSVVDGGPTDLTAKLHEWDPAAMDPFAIKCAAFYGDCPHEVKPVTKGYRLCVTYNLVNVDPQATLPRFGGNHTLYSNLKAALVQYFWDNHDASQKRQRLDENGASQVVNANIPPVETQHAAVLASVLSHKYTKVGMSFSFLKNKDLLAAQCLARFCDESGGAFTLYLSKLRYRFDWHGDEDSSYDKKSETGVNRTVTLLYPWTTYGASDDKTEPIDDDDEHPCDIPKAYEEDGLDVDPATQVVPKGLFSRRNFHFDGTNEQMYTGNDGANIEKWYSSAALVLVSLKQDAEWRFVETTTAALNDFVATAKEGRLSHARTMASAFASTPRQWSLTSPIGMKVIPGEVGLPQRVEGYARELLAD